MMTSKKYLNIMTETPKESYKNIIQATLDSEWEDNTQMYTIKEQKALPFEDNYEETKVYLDTISDDMINTSKVYSDFVKILFSDIDHKQNYKGQYYKIAINEDSEEEYYICYDRINKLSQIADTKVVRCNNVLTWKDDFGNIITMPCYLGTDIASTNNQISKKITIPNVRMIILVQANDYTLNIRKNQRFMFQNSSCFKVEEVNNYMQEQGTNGKVTCVKIYVDYSTILPTDNLELNICDYYKNMYEVKIDQDNLEQIKGFEGNLTATVKDNDEEVENIEIFWESDNPNIVEIDQDGNYIIKGNSGQSCIIKCYMKENIEIFDSIEISIVDSPILEKEIIVIPREDLIIKQGKYKDFICKVYSNGEELEDLVECIPNDINEKHYSIEEIDNGYRITNKQLSSNPLVLTFKAEDCEDVIINIKLKGAI